MLNRRDFILTGSALASMPMLEGWGGASLPLMEGASRHKILLNDKWTVARMSKAMPQQTSLDRGQLQQVTLPHCVSHLSWQRWDPSSWEDIWLYQRSLEIPRELLGSRLFLHFDRVMAKATVVVNGHSLPQHLGGFLPFEPEITNLVTGPANSLSIAVDSRWSNVPPSGSPKGPASIDYMLPGGICGSAELRAVPQIFIKDVWAKPVRVLPPDRRLEVTCNIDSALAAPSPVSLVAKLQHGERTVAQVSGVRINESANDPDLYRRTSEIAKSLDGSRHTSGTMTPSSKKDWHEQWHQDVFAFDDYHAASDGSVGIEEPVAGFPYLIAEAVGQYVYGTTKNFSRKYRRAGDAVEQADQALLHAQAHSRAGTFPHCCGLIAWCGFDYASLINAYSGVKCPGVVDTFRIPKLGASFYLAQVDPAVRVVVEPNFYWDFGPRTPAGPGYRSVIFSNCNRIEVFIDGKKRASLGPERGAFPNLRYPPFFVDLSANGTGKPELRIDGYIGDVLSLSRSFSSDSSTDRLSLSADDAVIRADGSDATRVVFGAMDKYGAPRPFVEGEVKLAIEGPGIIVGDNPFGFADSGGVGAVWIKSKQDQEGRIAIQAKHTFLGSSSLVVHSRKTAV